MVPDSVWEDYLRQMPVSLARNIEWLEGLPKSPPPPWHRRFYNRARAHILSVREAVAIWIAPWLDRETY